MSVRMLFPKNPLAAQLRAPGGLRVSDAMERAAANLQSMRAACLDELRAVIEDIEERFFVYPNEYDEAALGDLYNAACRSFGIAGACGMPAMDTALTSLCVLLENLKLRRTWDGDAVMVHAQSLRMLLNAAETNVDDNVEAVLDGLRRISVRYAPPPEVISGSSSP